MEGAEMNGDEEIRQVAYKLWQEEGCPDGCEVQHWLRAKMIWEEINRPQSEPKQSKALNKRKSRKISAAETEL
jgi:Protein of unknown function (DUF2934)